jgi:hypothetical protein
LVGFLSPSGAGVSASAASGLSGCCSSETELGVMTLSIGFMVEGAGVPNSGYMSAPGVDTKDSAGEFSNLTCGVEAGVEAVHEAIVFCVYRRWIPAIKEDFRAGWCLFCCN